MSGLDKIIEDIRAESAEAVRKITEDAEARRAEAMAAAEKEADAKAAKIRARAANQCSDLTSRADSAAQLERRRSLLKAKQELIAGTLEMAKKAVLDLPEADYFQLILKLILKNALPGKGEISFSKKDLERLPKDFASKIAANLPAGSNLSVSEKAEPIDGGFVLNYGGIEQNLSISAIFEEKKEQMTDIAGKILFG